MQMSEQALCLYYITIASAIYVAYIQAHVKQKEM